MATIIESMYPPSGSFIEATDKEAAAVAAHFKDWIKTHVFQDNSGLASKKLSFPLELLMRKMDGPAEVFLYESGNANPRVFLPTKDMQELATGLLKLLIIEKEPARWEVVWPDNKPRLTLLLS